MNDLLRRRTQTSLVVACLTLSVASTLFLLLFSSRIGVGIVSVKERFLTNGLLVIFSQFVWFVGVLIFIIGAVLTSFMVFLMMTQRTKDFGLIKAAGCPNDLLFGYYITELLAVTAASCLLGIILGLAADYSAVVLSNSPTYSNPPNLWLAPLVFVAFSVLALIFGTKPLLRISRLPASSALSSVQYFGSAPGSKAKPFTKSKLTFKVAIRSLFRRKTATVRIVLLLSTVFMLATVTVAGSIIARETTTSWIKKASGQNAIGIAHETMAIKYELLQSAFAGTADAEEFNYEDPRIAIPDSLIQGLRGVLGIGKIDTRFIVEDRVSEIANFTIDPDTLATIPIGDNRYGDSLVIGVDPSNLTGQWFVQGRLLENANETNCVIGDSIANTMFSQPLAQSLKTANQQFAIIGVCVDPINNGKVAYVPLRTLQEAKGVGAPNIVFAALDPNVDLTALKEQITAIVKSTSSDLMVFELDDIVDKNTAFLGSSWSTVMLLPTFSMSSAALCLMAYVMLAIDEQRQEFGILRAIGAKPKAVTNILAVQSGIVLLSSCGFGLSLGTITTMMVLMRQPLVTSLTIVEIAGWLLATIAGMFILSLVPAFKLSKTPLLRIMT